MQLNNLHSDHQFGYKAQCNTEALLLELLDEIKEGFDMNICTIVIFIDLSAAFDTVDIDLLINILETEIGISGTALKWFESFLRGRKQKVRINGQLSSEIDVMFGVPQGSVLGPFLYNIYTRSKYDVFSKHGFKSSGFADDDNGRKRFSLCFQYDILKNSIDESMQDIINWMHIHHLKINTDKTDIVLFHPKELKDSVIIRGTHIGENCIRFSSLVKNLGVFLDENLTMKNHINTTTSYGYKLLSDIGKIRNILSQKHTEVLVHSVISSRMDYCNSLFINTNHASLKKLQKLQNSAARLVTRTRKRESMTPILQSLHWLSVESRLAYKVLLLTYKMITNTYPLVFNLTYKQFSCRPDDHLKLATYFPRTKYGRKTFAYVAPRLWNSLPLYMRLCEDVMEYKKQLKTFLFKNDNLLKSVCK